MSQNLGLDRRKHEMARSAGKDLHPTLVAPQRATWQRALPATQSATCSTNQPATWEWCESDSEIHTATYATYVLATRNVQRSHNVIFRPCSIASQRGHNVPLEPCNMDPSISATPSPAVYDTQNMYDGQTFHQEYSVFDTKIFEKIDSGG